MDPKCKINSGCKIDSSCNIIDSSDCIIDSSCNQKMVKKSYRKMSLTVHPDRPGGTAENMTKVNKANEVLSDLCNRKLYDEGKYEDLKERMEGENQKGRDGGGKRTRRKKRHRKKKITRKRR